MVIIVAVAALGVLFWILSSRTEPEENILSPEEPIIKVAQHPELGRYLTDNRGFALYKAMDTCYQCPNIWLPYTTTLDYVNSIDPLSHKLEVYSLEDGRYQYVFEKEALYYHRGDINPGDINGHGIENGNWSIVPIE